MSGAAGWAAYLTPQIAVTRAWDVPAEDGLQGAQIRQQNVGRRSACLVSSVEAMGFFNQIYRAHMQEGIGFFSAYARKNVVSDGV